MGNYVSGTIKPLVWVGGSEAGWQPIETAPKDGTEIIGVFSNDYGYQKNPTVYGPWTIMFNGKSWVSSWDGLRVIDSQGDRWTEYRDPDIEPTHWIPLPDPPQLDYTPQAAPNSEAGELLPCPFCGSDPERITIGDDDPSNAGGDVISCTGCLASSHVEFGRKENLESCWNRRRLRSRAYIVEATP